MKNVVIVIRAEVEDEHFDAIKKMEHHAEAITENYPELGNISVKVSSNEYPYGLDSSTLSDIYHNFSKVCNKEDILESSEITDEERNNDDFIEKAMSYYEDMRNDNEDWSYYAVSAIKRARKDMLKNSTKCVDCGFNHKTINYKITVSSGKYVYCPNCLASHVLNGFPFELIGNDDSICEITGSKNAVKLDDSLFSENGEHFRLKADIFKRLISRNLNPNEHKKLIALHSWDAFLLHDDFYDDEHNALQPM